MANSEVGKQVLESRYCFLLDGVKIPDRIGPPRCSPWHSLTIGALVVAALIAVTCGSSLLVMLWHLAAGHPNAGSDPAGFGMGLGYIFFGTLAGMALSGIALLVYRPIWPWAVCALAMLASIFALILIVDKWNDRLLKKNVP